jgi:pSer/pThr/pTyr-binding forkhead associated (FHA) protein
MNRQPDLPPQLIVLNGPHKGDVIVLDDAIPVVFGSRAGVRLPEPGLDGVHCQVFPVEGRWFLQDFGSQGGTWIGDERVVGMRPLPYGRSFRVGGTLVGLVKPDPAAPATASAQGEPEPESEPEPEPEPEPESESGALSDSVELVPAQVDLGKTAEFNLTLKPAADGDEVLPDTVGEYTIQAKLGQGAQGPVYKAFDGRRQRVVALKLLSPELGRDRLAVGRFLRGAKAGGRLKHPNLVAIYAAGHTRHRVYVAMELVDGPDLEAACVAKGGKLAPREAVALMLGVAEGLVYAHGRQVLHRNVNPGNVLVGPGRWPKLSDLSLAKRQGSGKPMEFTASDDVLLMSPYAAPEAVFDAQHVDARTDVYGVGATLYRALTGKPPYSHEAPAAFVKGAFDDPRQHVDTLSDALVELLRRCLSPQPDARFQSMEALRDALLALPESAVV